jgi:hypothetical protein
LKALHEDVLRLRRLWNEHTHRPFPAKGGGAQEQEVALYSAWLGSIVEVALRRGGLDPEHAAMLRTRRAEGNQGLFLAAAELGDPVRSYVARLITIEDILSGLPEVK